MRQLAACTILHNPETKSVLLGRHKNRGWMLPGGKNEGEPIVQTAIREFAEETGVHLIGEPRFFAYQEHDNWLCMVFEMANPIGNWPFESVGEEIFEAWRFWPLESLPERMYAPTREVLEDFGKRHNENQRIACKADGSSQDPDSR